MKNYPKQTKTAPANNYLCDIFCDGSLFLITKTKRFCMKCRAVSHRENCCGEPTHNLTKSARPPRKNASENKWQLFIKKCVWFDKRKLK